MTVIDDRRLHNVEQTLAVYDLHALYPYWLEYNSGEDNSYHGQQHLAVVGLHAHRLAEKHLDTSEEALALLLAGLYHDYDHTADIRVNDKVNIRLALTAWETIAIEFGFGDLKDQVSRLISVTEHSAKASTPDEFIIREADYSYELEPDRELWYELLSKELKQPITAESTREYLGALEFRYLELPKTLRKRS